MRENILKDKSYQFAVEIIKLCHNLRREKKEYVLTNQILKSGTSIGANIREAEFGQSKADFINKMSISLKEANETRYWLDLLRDTGYLKNDTYNKLYYKITELIRILVSTVKTSKTSAQNS